MNNWSWLFFLGLVEAGVEEGERGSASTRQHVLWLIEAFGIK